VSGPENVPATHGIGDGPTLFARYAYPPNERGYCGPDDHGALLEYGASRTVDPGLTELARAFSGAWPYLAFIAEATGIGDPLDRRVVEAYWVGSPLLEHVDMACFGNAMRERFRPRTGRTWTYLAESIPAGALPHHAFHVFEVYPWVGLLGADRGDTPLHILDRCRIRWGMVLSVDGDQAVVRERPLVWDGHQLSIGPAHVAVATVAAGGLGFVEGLRVGDWVAMHWGWICDRLTDWQLANLRCYTLRQLDITNRKIGHPGPAMVLS
jgi:hypothetical protein